MGTVVRHNRPKTGQWEDSGDYDDMLDYLMQQLLDEVIDNEQQEPVDTELF